jgi:hypothetical protein
MPKSALLVVGRSHPLVLQSADRCPVPVRLYNPGSPTITENAERERKNRAAPLPCVLVVVATLVSCREAPPVRIEVCVASPRGTGAQGSGFPSPSSAPCLCHSAGLSVPDPPSSSVGWERRRARMGRWRWPSQGSAATSPNPRTSSGRNPLLRVCFVPVHCVRSLVQP